MLTRHDHSTMLLNVVLYFAQGWFQAWAQPMRDVFSHIGQAQTSNQPCIYMYEMHADTSKMDTLRPQQKGDML